MRHQQLRVIQEPSGPAGEGNPAEPSAIVGGAAEAFECRVIDDDPMLLRQSYALRYRAYCVDRAFLPAERYPDGLETDAFDRCSVHIGVVAASGELLATARLVAAEPSATALPLLRYCSVFPEHTELSDPNNRVVEVSRLVTTRDYPGWPPPRGVRRRQIRRHVFEALLKGTYQASKRIQATHWIAATERSLQRRMDAYGLPFRAVGPEADYSGPVTPYLMSLAEFDAVILSGRSPVLDDLLLGLEPRFQPHAGPRTYGRHARRGAVYALQPCRRQV